MAPFKLDNVVIIAPGSRYVNAQMGVGETPTPPKYRFPSRMFPTEHPGQFEPVKIHVRKRVKTKSSNEKEQTNGTNTETTVNGEHKPSDTPMTDAPAQDVSSTTNGEIRPTTPKNASGAATEPAVEMEEYFEEDPESDEGAVWPIVEGRIDNHACFFALMTHVFHSLSPNFNSPVIIIAPPVWTLRDYENVTKVIFQQWTSPALHIADAACLALWGIGCESGLVVDVGYEKCDITPILQGVIDHPARRASLEKCGGRSMTLKLQELLKDKGFTEDMAEQLKKSSFCEILPPGSTLPGTEIANGNDSNPAAAASTGATTSGANAKEEDGLRPGQAPRGPGEGTEAGEEDDNEGVLDVASIVARDNAAELLAKREQERAAKAASKKGGVQDMQKQVRMKNSEKPTATFTYTQKAAADEGANGTVPDGARKQEVEVGVERFMAAETMSGSYEGILDTIAWNIRSAIFACQDMAVRPVLWDHIFVCGNGSRVKGKPPRISLERCTNSC